MPYPTHRYTEDQKAGALALVRQGKSAEHAAAELGLPSRSVQRWGKRHRETSVEEDDPLLQSESFRLAMRAAELLHTALDQIEDEGNPAKYAAVLNAIRGTSIDKLLWERKLTPEKVDETPFVIVLDEGPTG